MKRALNSLMSPLSPTLVLNTFFGCSKDELVAEELKVLDACIATGTLVYNSVIAGRFNLESREKMAAAHRGVKLTDEHKEKIAAARRGAKLTDDHKEKLSKIRQGVGCVAYYAGATGKCIWMFSAPPHRKPFACKKYGYWQAKLLAEAERSRRLLSCERRGRSRRLQALAA